METTTGTIDQKMQDWLNTTINGWLAQEMKTFGKPMYLIQGEMTGDYKNSFGYDGKEIRIGVIAHGVEVGDHNPGTPQYIAPLGDVYRVPDLLKAMKAVEQERGIQIDIGDTMDFEQILQDVSGEKASFNPIYILKDKGVKNLPEMKKFTQEIITDIEKILGPDYEIILNTTSYRIIISPKNSSAKQKIINHDPTFEKALQDILTYRKEILPTKLAPVDEIIARQQWENNSDYSAQLEIIDFLRKQLSS